MNSEDCIYMFIHLHVYVTIMDKEEEVMSMGGREGMEEEGGREGREDNDEI